MRKCTREFEAVTVLRKGPTWRQAYTFHIVAAASRLDHDDDDDDDDDDPFGSKSLAFYTDRHCFYNES